jgi:hypothetical protein
MFVAVMLARERRWHADTTADGCTEFGAVLAALPSRPLELVADALEALDRPTELECEIPTKPYAAQSGGCDSSSVHPEDGSEEEHDSD